VKKLRARSTGFLPGASTRTLYSRHVFRQLLEKKLILCQTGVCFQTWTRDRLRSEPGRNHGNCNSGYLPHDVTNLSRVFFIL